MKPIFLIVFLVYFHNILVSQTGIIKEVAIEFCNKTIPPELIGKKIRLLSEVSNRSAVIDMNGKSKINSLLIGEYRVIIGDNNNFEVQPSIIKVENNTTSLKFTILKALNSVIDTLEPNYQIENSQITRSSHLRLSQFLQYNLSIFHSTFQTVADFTDHINPAAMKGLSTDHMLVLVNGVRLHSSSLVNVNRSFGKGSVSYDLDIIPMSSIDRIEVYRTAASVRYGSDAIAGIINILTIKPKNKEIAINGGIHSGGTIPRLEINDGIGNQYYLNATIPILSAQDDPCTNTTLLIGAEFSRLGPLNRSGNFNYQTTGVYLIDKPEEDLKRITDRDFWSKTGFPDHRVLSAGRAGTDNFSTYFQLNSDNSDGKNGFSIFGNYSTRSGLSSVFYRFPKDINRGGGSSLYPDGFSPKLLSNSQDYFIGFNSPLFNPGGFSGSINGSYGVNALTLNVNNSINAALGASSPTSFYAGGFRYQQGYTTALFTNDKKKKNVYLSDFGIFYRFEKYKIIKGDTSSLINKKDNSIHSGSQGYPGLGQEVFADRSTLGSFAEVFFESKKPRINGKIGGRAEWVIKENILVPIGKLSIKWKASKEDRIFIGGSYNGGFKAPSLQQSYFTSISSQTSQNKVRYVNTFNNNDYKLRDSLGFRTLNKNGKQQLLKPEYSHTGSLGLDFSDSTTTFSINFYYTSVRNRIILSGQIDSINQNGQKNEFAPIFKKYNVASAQFFLNAVNSNSFGVDAYVKRQIELADQYQITLSANMFYNISTRITREKAQSPQSDQNPKVDLGDNIVSKSLLSNRQEMIFNREEIALLEKGQPSYKLILSLLISRNVGKKNARFELGLHSTTFGGVQYWSPQTETSSRDQYYSSKTLIDTRFAYSFPENKLQLFTGINNLFDTYPDRNLPANTDNNQFLYSRRSPQFDLTGRYFYTGLRLNL